MPGCLALLSVQRYREGGKLLGFGVVGCAVGAPLGDADGNSDGLPVGKRAWNN
jgi:hypothetical protein